MELRIKAMATDFIVFAAALGGHGFEPRWSPDILLLSNCLNWKIYCDDHCVCIKGIKLL